MALHRAVLERQLADVKRKLTICEQALNDAGVPPDQLSRHAEWRHVDADRRQITRRLRAAAALEQRGQRTESES